MTEIGSFGVDPNEGSVEATNEAPTVETVVLEEEKPRRRAPQRRRRTKADDPHSTLPWELFNDAVEFANSFKALPQDAKELFFRTFNWESPEVEKPIETVLQVVWSSNAVDQAAYALFQEIKTLVWSSDNVNYLDVIAKGTAFSEITDEEALALVSIVNAVTNNADNPIKIDRRDRMAVFGDIITGLTAVKSDSGRVEYINRRFGEFDELFLVWPPTE